MSSSKYQASYSDLFSFRMFNEQRAAAVRVIEAKPSVTTTHKVAYKQIREDFQRQMGSL